MKEILELVTNESLKYNRKIANENSMIFIEFYKDTPFYAIVYFYTTILDYLIRKNLYKKYIVYSSIILEDDSVLFKISKS